jgi:hypothetical protein
MDTFILPCVIAKQSVRTIIGDTFSIFS